MKTAPQKNSSENKGIEEYSTIVSLYPHLFPQTTQLSAKQTYIWPLISPMGERIVIPKLPKLRWQVGQASHLFFTSVRIPKSSAWVNILQTSRVMEKWKVVIITIIGNSAKGHNFNSPTHKLHQRPSHELHSMYHLWPSHTYSLSALCASPLVSSWHPMCAPMGGTGEPLWQN